MIAGYHDHPAERLPDVAEQVLQKEAAHPRAGIEGREDEERLEHDREVIPEVEPAAAASAREKIFAMPTARVGAPPVRSIERGLAHLRSPAHPCRLGVDR